MTGVWMTSGPEAKGWENLMISKKTSVVIGIWARPVQLGATGCAARLLGQFVEIWLWAKWVDIWLWTRQIEIGLSAGQFSWGVDCVQCRNSQQSKNCVSFSHRVEKLKVKKWKNVSYLNYGESSVFRDFLASVYLYSCIMAIQDE